MNNPNLVECIYQYLKNKYNSLPVTYSLAYEDPCVRISRNWNLGIIFYLEMFCVIGTKYCGFYNYTSEYNPSNPEFFNNIDIIIKEIL